MPFRTIFDPQQSAHYRWWLASGLFVVLMVSSGFGFYNLSVYMSVLAERRGFAISEVSAAVGVFFITGGVVGIAIGRLLERLDVRYVLCAGAAVGGVSLACIGLVDSVWQLFVLYACFGAGNACVSLIPATTLVTRWFDERGRAMALSFASTGLSVGGVVLTPLSVMLLNRWPVENAMPIFGVVYCVGIVAISTWLVRSWPPDSSNRGTPGQTPGVPAGTPYRAAWRSRFFLVLTAAYVLVMAGQVGGIAHLFPRGVEVVGALDASIAVSLLASASVAGRLLGGMLVAWIEIKAFTALNLIGQIVGLMVLGLAEHSWLLWIGAAVFGFTVGNLLMLQPLMLAQAYGVASYSRIFSTAQAATMLGVAGGPVLLGLLFEWGGYSFAFGVAATMSLAALGLLLSAGPVPSVTPAGARYPNAVDGAAETEVQ